MILSSVKAAAVVGIISGGLTPGRPSFGNTHKFCTHSKVYGVRISFNPQDLVSFCSSYHSLDDRRLPSKFICFDCRIRGDRNYAMIAVNDLLPNMISKYNGLVLFRYDVRSLCLVRPSHTFYAADEQSRLSRPPIRIHSRSSRRKWASSSNSQPVHSTYRYAY